MRILMVAPQPFFRPRGTPFSVLHRIRALLRLGHGVELVTYPFGDTPELDGCVVHRSARPPGVRDVAIGPSVAKLLLDGPVFTRALALARSGRFDLIHTHEEAGAMGAWISKRLGLPHVYDMHSSLPEQLANFGRFNWRPLVAAFRTLERYTLAGSDGVITICPALRDLVVAAGYPGPVAMIENVIAEPVAPSDPARVEALARRAGVAGGPVILYAGTLEAYQGMDLLVDAAERVLAEVPCARFVIVGGKPEAAARLERRARALRVGSDFVFVPTVPPSDVWTYYAMADVLVTCRVRGINTPLKLYQYLQVGKPIVATDIPSHTQLLDRASAELVAPTADGVAAGLLRVLRDPVHAASLVAGAARLANERLREDTYLERVSGLLDEVTGSPRPLARTG
jgi:glycosyltransferase involved in cell wall biosynthesis